MEGYLKLLPLYLKLFPDIDATKLTCPDVAKVARLRSSPNPGQAELAFSSPSDVSTGTIIC